MMRKRQNDTNEKVVSSYTQSRAFNDSMRTVSTTIYQQFLKIR